MADESIEENGNGPTDDVEEARRRFFTRRKILGIVAGIAISIILVAGFTYVLYRTGVFDGYVKEQFVVKMSDIGVNFNADVFRVTASPFALELKNATFNNKTTGEKLFFVRDAHLGLSVKDLFAWRLSRDITINTTDINGAEVWVKFDENGRSNFADLTLVEDEAGSAVNFKYDTVELAVRDSVIHYGDVSREFAGDAKNLAFLLSPANEEAASQTKAPGARFNFELSSSDSNFRYQDKTIDDIEIRAKGTADNKGADFRDLIVRTSVGTTALNGTIRDWADPKYEFDVESTVDITQISNIFSPSSGIRGIGNFKGRITGKGETYQIDGTADSESLRAAGVYLKAVNVTATVEGTNLNYRANGNAVAEMLTFEDFQIDFPKLVGNVRGTGTDFRWVGELQAIAASSPSLTLGGLFLSDAVAEYKDRQFRASAGNARAQKFSLGDQEFEDVRARDLRFSAPGGNVNLTSASLNARSLKSKDYTLNGVTGTNASIKRSGGRTDVTIRNLRAENAVAKGTKITNIAANEFKLNDTGNRTELTATDLTASRIDANGTRISGVVSPLTRVVDENGVSVIYADKLRVASIDADAAVIGSLNIAGVRLTIKKGRVEGRSNDIDAGTITLKENAQLRDGGTLDAVRIMQPVFVLEPSGRYRATADMSIGGGMVGSVSLGSANAKVDINNDRALLDQLTARVMDGNVNGSVVVAFNKRSESRIDATFSGLDLSKFASMQSGRVIPLSGDVSGNAVLSFPGTDIRSASGSINAKIFANAGNADQGLVPINGNVELNGNNGLFEVRTAELDTGKSQLNATGRFDLKTDESNLGIALNSTDASEIDRLIRLTGVSPELEQQLDSLKAEFAGNLKIDAAVTGNLYDPNLKSTVNLDSISLQGRELGSLSAKIDRTPDLIKVYDGKLADRTGGSADFAINIPNAEPNGITINATLNGVNAGNLLAALPIELPERISDLNGKTYGTVAISGLPNAAQGNIDLSAANGTIAGYAFDNLKAKAIFNGTRVELESGEIRFGDGTVSATGNYERGTGIFNADLTGKAVPLPLVVAFLPKTDTTITGTVDLTAHATGELDRPSSYDVNFNGTARDVAVNGNAFGDVVIAGKTEGQVLTANVVADLGGRRQVIDGTLNLNDENLPFSVKTVFSQSPITPYFAFVPQLKDVPITAVGTGLVEFGGQLRQRNASGEFEYSTNGLSGKAEFTELALNIQETPLTAVEPVTIRFNTRELVFESAKFAGGGSNVTVRGTKALSDDAVNDLSIDGRISLNLLNLAKTDIFFGGAADLAIRLAGPNSTARLSGTATTDNATFATFIGSDRLTFDRVKTTVIFTANQAEIESATGYLGGGKFRASGGASLRGISVQAFRFTVAGDNVTVPLPNDFMTTGDARLEITGARRNSIDDIQIRIGGRVYARKALYTKDIDLATIVGGRRDTSLSSGGSSLSAPKFDLVIEGRDALIVRNNIADLTASISLTLTGDANNPRLAGRITANSGTLFYRKDRYDIQRGVLEFPPDTSIEPVISLQAETEIGGYQIFVNLSGPLSDTQNLSATLRSSPALPQADVVSLITTGSVTNSAGGISTLAQTGINTAAEILTDSIINNPARKATDKLFGLNVFEIDPIIAGEQVNPGARLTVGRQINNNLRVTYSTNLSQDQKQVLALEYRVSNKLSFVAQYEQRALSNVTRNRDNFSFEIRFRRRF